MQKGLKMSYWMYCNSCFHYPSLDRKLAVTSCGHVICSVCFQKGKQGSCLICNTKCQISPISDHSSSEVKALFSDLNVVATKYFSEISKVIMFQAKHQQRLLTHYQQRNLKLEELLVKMRHEMHYMTQKLNEQSTYISTLENSLQQQSAQVSSTPQMTPSSDCVNGQTPVVQIPYNPPVSLSLSSTTNFTVNTEVDEWSLFKKPNTVPRLSLINPPQDGQMGTIPHGSSNQNLLGIHSTRSATVSRFLTSSPVTSDTSYSQSFGWKSPIFLPTTFGQSTPSLASPPP